MSSHLSLTRRTFASSTAAAALVAAAGPAFIGTGAFAQGIAADDWKKLIALYQEAKKLGINLPSMSEPSSGSAKFYEIIPALVDFIDHLEDAKLSGEAAKSRDFILARARGMLAAINANERHPRQGALKGDDSLLGLLFATPAWADISEERYLKYRDGYIQLFNTCVVNPDKKSNVAWYVDKLSSDKYRSAYQQLEDVVCVPWYFIGVIHALETSFNFQSHLHNGDPLSHKTVHVPAGRPVPWLPPSDWQSSAKDALQIEGYVNHTDWNLAKLLYRLEAYNGMRSREEHGINSPYLWSFSNHYTSGKFVADNVWSSTAVSQQCGAAVMIKELVNRGLVVPVA